MTIKRHIAGALALSLGLSTAACSGPAWDNASLYSVRQPVVARTTYTLDLASGYEGLSVPEQQRLAGWFEAMDLRYGDRVSIEDPVANGATKAAVASLAARHGILLADGAPVTEGYVQPGTARVVITRSSASVPNCPNWERKTDSNYANATSPGYGCSINGNMAAMIANPEDLIAGQKGTGETVIMSSTKAIETYREKANTGAGELKASATGGGK
ncbi:Pilus biogenesis CpaD protein (pilus_cpaD) [Tsuneonella dongtanensis]|uniref:Pilus biogenesis CpaD protein (Pilus_cpaD) n=1 Tax=Tsuneonella dongtanensis TaxID=692370 RepID=A0A1B2AGS9_9SPHN|nr:CpaD family pilus assembly protein [Tsuneonella dongtanensis]ANY21318.1 Pilus biogenesis CpaD protein (pilus_cpaD) [Tsuneonella dongtanensis]